MLQDVDTSPNSVMSSLDQVARALERASDAGEAWRALARFSIILDPPQPEKVFTVGPFEVRSVAAKGAVKVAVPEGARVRVFVTGGGQRLSFDSGRIEFVKLGDQADVAGPGEVTLHPVAGYGDAGFLCVCEGEPARVEALDADAGGPVEAPYYWSYDKRYAQTYEEGGQTWETMDPNDIVRKLVPELIESPDSQQIIDLGCGEGRDTLWLAAQGYRVTGVDVSSAALGRARALAREQGLSPVFLERDVIFLRGIEQDSFALALNMGCLHMLDADEDRRGHLQRVFEILEPGGAFVVNHCREAWLKGFWSVEDYEAVKSAVPGDVIPRKVRLPDGGTKVVEMEVLRHKVAAEDELKAELEAVGFTDIRILSEDHFTFGNSAILVCRKP